MSPRQPPPTRPPPRPPPRPRHWPARTPRTDYRPRPEGAPHPTTPADGLVDDRVVNDHRRRHRTRSPIPQLSRPHDVGQHERHRPRRQTRTLHIPMIRPTQAPIHGIGGPPRHPVASTPRTTRPQQGHHQTTLNSSPVPSTTSPHRRTTARCRPLTRPSVPCAQLGCRQGNGHGRDCGASCVHQFEAPTGADNQGDHDEPHDRADRDEDRDTAPGRRVDRCRRSGVQAGQRLHGLRDAPLSRFETMR